MQRTDRKDRHSQSDLLKLFNPCCVTIGGLVDLVEQDRGGCSTFPHCRKIALDPSNRKILAGGCDDRDVIDVCSDALGFYANPRHLARKTASPCEDGSDTRGFFASFFDLHPVPNQRGFESVDLGRWFTRMVGFGRWFTRIIGLFRGRGARGLGWRRGRCFGRWSVPARP